MEDALRCCHRWRRRWAQAHCRDWKAAQLDAARRLCGSVDRLRQQAEAILDELHRSNDQADVISAADLYREIDSLGDEFDSVTVKRSIKTLCVRTDEIVLEGVYLGRFDIILRWDRLSESHPYHVIATDSDYEARDGTSHPHVQGERLCEGEGATVIKRALREGRLLDFFIVVDRILKTYNSQSAYVSLDEWEGVGCRACGDTVDSDYLYRCDRCESELCSDCSVSCDHCSDRFCSECLGRCAGCDSDCCRDCRKSCDVCDDYFCDSCLTEGLCDDCTDRKDQTPEEDSGKQTQQSCASVHALCDGQAVVPA